MRRQLRLDLELEQAPEAVVEGRLLEVEEAAVGPLKRRWSPQQSYHCLRRYCSFEHQVVAGEVQEMELALERVWT